MQKTEKKMKKLTDKIVKYYALKGKVKFVKLIWKKMLMNNLVFM